MYEMYEFEVNRYVKWESDCIKKSQGTFPGTDCGTDRRFPTGLCKMGEGGLRYNSDKLKKAL